MEEQTVPSSKAVSPNSTGKVEKLPPGKQGDRLKIIPPDIRRPQLEDGLKSVPHKKRSMARKRAMVLKRVGVLREIEAFKISQIGYPVHHISGIYLGPHFHEHNRKPDRAQIPPPGNPEIVPPPAGL